MRAIRSVMFLAGLSLAVGCAAKEPASRPSSATAPRRDRDLITQEEIDATKAQDAYSVVRMARPGWLLPKTLGSGRVFVQVYVEGNKAGDVSTLRQYNASTIRELRFLGGDDATTRFGTGNGAGAILVFLKR